MKSTDKRNQRGHTIKEQEQIKLDTYTLEENQKEIAEVIEEK